MSRPRETYCDRFRKNAESNEFDNPQPGDEAKLIDELETFSGLAPEELKDDYDVLISAVEGESDRFFGSRQEHPGLCSRRVRHHPRRN